MVRPNFFTLLAALMMLFTLLPSVINAGDNDSLRRRKRSSPQSLYGGDGRGAIGLALRSGGLYGGGSGASYGGSYSTGGGGGGRYKRNTVGYGAAGLGGFGGYGLGLGLGYGGFGGLGGFGLGSGFGGIIGGYPSAHPSNYVGYYDTSPVKLGAAGDSYANQNYKPYALRATINADW